MSTRNADAAPLSIRTRVAIGVMCLILIIAAAIYVAAIFFWGIRDGATLLAAGLSLIVLPTVLVLLAPLALVGHYPKYLCALIPAGTRNGVIGVFSDSARTVNGRRVLPRIIAILAVVFAIGVWTALRS